NKRRNQGRPPRLMRGAKAGAVVAVKELVKLQRVLPVRIGLERRARPKDGAAARGVRQEETLQTTGQIAAHPRETHAAASRERHFEIGAERLAELAKRLDEQEIRGKPNRPTPIRVAPLDLRRRVPRFVLHRFAGVLKRVLFVEFRQAADAEGGQK